ncbi:N-acetyl-D-glucosamine kinase [Streptomyces sp. RB5]|uniref:N-acetyl-D-glucosamine kinase n=1 Tax=Streptomyces smaragdinus TaxID=2585196 RepID=A0A7K0CDP4_9ACTN|nr:ROK family transcriptional regulator [Streptomyces smaragdinus]MQY11202.1 N-acetyl-D-glucosamine kinase [Streptomyces smaragdinus]
MTTAGGDSSLLRRLNTTAVLRTLYGGGPFTLSELVRATAVTRATVENALAALVRQGWAAEVPPAADGRRPVGRPPRRYRFRAESGCVVGLDIGAHKVLAVVADLGGEVRAVRQTAVARDVLPEDRLAAAWKLGHRARRAAGFEADQVRAVGVGATGVVNAAGTVLVSELLPGWAGTELPVELGKSFGAPVAAGNDTNVALLAEHWRGVAAGARDVLFLHAGHEISAGLLIGGRVHQGRHGAAGEIGMLPAAGWSDTARAMSEGWGEDIGALFEAARSRDAKAVESLRRFCEGLTHGAAAMVLAVDPELVVLGGGLSRAGDLLADPLRRGLREACLFPVPVAVSELGVEAVALGAVRLALDEVERELFEMAGVT